MTVYQSIVNGPLVWSLINDLLFLIPYLIVLFSIGYSVWLIPYIIKKFI